VVEVRCVTGTQLDLPIRLLEEFGRGGEPVPHEFAPLLREEIERGSIEVLGAHSGDAVLGVAVLAFRPSISAGGRFASVEELYVKPEARRRGIGRALLGAVQERCVLKNISYVEVQISEEDALSFYRAMGYGVEDGVSVLSSSVVLGRP
jgi:ribosomal protein S18 acetylase RimI-like enzyme